MQSSFVIFDKISHAKEIVSKCKLLCPLECGLESHILSIRFTIYDIKLAYLTQIIESLKITEMDENSRPSGPAPLHRLMNVYVILTKWRCSVLKFYTNRGSKASYSNLSLITLIAEGLLYSNQFIQICLLMSFCRLLKTRLCLTVSIGQSIYIF